MTQHGLKDTTMTEFGYRRQGVLAAAVVGAVAIGWGILISSASEKETKPMGAADLGKAHLRVARPTDDLDAVVKFYKAGLGFSILYEFKDHDGFDGVMLGHKGAAYHLEFTRKTGHKAGKAPTEDNLLVFYLPDEDEWKRAIERWDNHGYTPVKAFNPYWDKRGKTFVDPDGYRVVLQQAKWPG